MFKSTSLLALAAFISAGLMAQDNVVTNLKSESQKSISKDGEQPEGWTKKGLLNINFSQGSTSNWSAGSDKFSLSTNLIFNYQALYKKDRRNWDNSLDINYGLVNTTSTGLRKNDDRIDLLSKYGYQIDTTGKWLVTVLGNFRTQLTDGQRYFKSDITGNDTSEIVSTFLAPANILISPGMEWKPSGSFNLFLSPSTARWIVVSRRVDQLSELYGIEPGKKARFEIGAFLTANFNKDIFKNVNYKAKLDLFSNYRHNPQNIDVFFTNLLSMKVNEWLSVTYNVDVIYDDDALRPDGTHWGTQFKSLLGIGFAAKF
ncbi:MAG TPA: DUF3078 domain-containing protein [Parasegetibacter sp.]